MAALSKQDPPAWMLTNWGLFQLELLKLTVYRDRETLKAVLSTCSVTLTGPLGFCCSLQGGSRSGAVSPVSRSTSFACPFFATPGHNQAPRHHALYGDAGGSDCGAELRNNVADGDGGQRGGIGLVVGLDRLVGRRIGPELVHSLHPGLRRRKITQEDV